MENLRVSRNVYSLLRALSLSVCSLCSIQSLEVARISVSLRLGFVPLPWNHITD